MATATHAATPAAAGPCSGCGGAGCEACERSTQSALIHREVLALALLIAVAAAAFFFTRWAADANQRVRLRDAAAWYERGGAELAAGRLPAAVDALRSAAELDRRNMPYRLALAGALTASHDDASAAQILTGLRALTPDSAPINLQLARLEQRTGRHEAAIAYYQNALYGRWDRDQAEALRIVRLELIDYLLAVGAQSRALSELLVVSGNIRDTTDDHRAISGRFLLAHEPRRALEHLGRALQISPNDGAALAMSGQAAFELGDYASAQRFFRTAPETEATATARGLTAAVLAGDPLAPRLAASERRARILQVVTTASARLASCPLEDAALLRARADSVTTAARKSSANLTDLAEEGVRVALQLETAAASCGPGAEIDRAVVLIARRHGLDQP